MSAEIQVKIVTNSGLTAVLKRKKSSSWKMWTKVIGIERGKVTRFCLSEILKLINCTFYVKIKIQEINTAAIKRKSRTKCGIPFCTCSILRRSCVWCPMHLRMFFSWYAYDTSVNILLYYYYYYYYYYCCCCCCSCYYYYYYYHLLSILDIWLFTSAKKF